LNEPDRTFFVEAEPNALYRDLHQVAEAAFDAVTGVVKDGATMDEIVDAAGIVEQRGFTTCDDLMHGFGGGYFQPILGSRSRPRKTARASCVVECNSKERS
jgi:hypothetical protein